MYMAEPVRPIKIDYPAGGGWAVIMIIFAWKFAANVYNGYHAIRQPEEMMKLKGKVWTAVAAMAILFMMVGMAAAGQKPAAKPATEKNQAPQTPIVKETITINWPTEVKWFSDYVSTREKGRTELFYPEGQSKTNWTEMVSTEATYSKVPDLTEMARIILMGTKQGCPDAVMEILEKSPAGAGSPTLIFELRCPTFLAKQPAEVQLWKLFAGQSGLYTLQYTWRGETLPAEKRTEALTLLKKSKLVVETPQE